jgi:hypothetical protein
MFWYLFKYYAIISVAATLPLLIVLAVLPHQSLSSVVFLSLRWAGIIAGYLTYRYFTYRNYWILFQNSGLTPLPLLVGAGILFESVVIATQIWVHVLSSSTP